MYAPELVTAPEVEPLELVDAKRHARVRHDRDDALFTETLIPAARRYVENQCGLALIEQEWKAAFDSWDDVKGLRLRPHPVAELVSVKVWDGSEFATLDLSDFQLVTGRRPALVFTADNASPLIPLRRRAGIEITFQSGYGENAAAVPADLRLAMGQLVAHWYENREPTAISQNLSVVGTIKHQVDALLRPYLPLRVA